MMQLLAQHEEHSEVCFGADGTRDAAQLTAHAEAIAHAVGDLPQGSHVVLACRDRYHFCATLLAAAQRGWIALLPESGQPEVAQSFLSRPDVGALLHDSDLGGLDVRSVEDPRARAAPPVTPRRAPDQTFVVAYTSGSTGAPAAHPKSLSQLTRESAEHSRCFRLSRARIVSAVPPHHIYGLLFGVVLPMISGGSVLRDTPLFPDALISAIDEASARALVAVPAHLTALAQYSAPQMPRLDRAFSSAGPLPAATSHTLRDRGLTVTEVLGSTETGGIAFRTQPDADWQGFAGVEIEADDQGVMSVRSPWASADGSGWVKTADRIELTAQGLRHLGRVDGVVKVGGRRVDLRDMERQLSLAPGVKDARVLAVDDPGSGRGTQLWAVVTGANLAVSELRRTLGERFDPVTWPRRFRMVAALPVNLTGKVTRQSLLNLFDGDLRNARP